MPCLSNTSIVTRSAVFSSPIANMSRVDTYRVHMLVVVHLKICLNTCVGLAFLCVEISVLFQPISKLCTLSVP